MASVKQLVLASGSPFRKALLASTGVEFSVRVAPVDEATVAGLPPPELALGRARLKARAVAASAAAHDALVIGADQVLSFHGRTFDKAQSAAEAAARLAELAGHTHYLHSAVVLYIGGAAPRELAAFVVDVKMPMRPLTAAEIAAYVATDEWRGAVGCYQFENRGVHLFDGVDADHSAIVGLPLQRLLAALRSVGVDALTVPAPPWPLI